MAIEYTKHFQTLGYIIHNTEQFVKGIVKHFGKDAEAIHFLFTS